MNRNAETRLSSSSPSPVHAADVHRDVPLRVDFVHRLRCTRAAFDPDNEVLLDVLEASGDRARVLVFVDSALDGPASSIVRRIEQYFAVHARRAFLAAPVRTVVGGEACKNDTKVVQDALEAIHDADLCRHSYVIVVGGGAVLDAVGYAAAISHRGIRLVRLPSTTLAQADSGVGVKNGINAFGKKNYLGVFAPPWAVVNDEQLLETLPQRDWRCGFSEVVKVALLKDASLFERTEAKAASVDARDMEISTELIRRSAELHLNHIALGGDPFEHTEARPLDFGHWAAHKLEQITRFEVRHGEAVAIGLAVDVVYTAMRDELPWVDAHRVLQCLNDLGFALYHEALEDIDSLWRGLQEFREHLGGRLTITLIRAVGDGYEVHEMSRVYVAQAIHYLKTYSSRISQRFPRAVTDSHVEV